MTPLALTLGLLLAVHDFYPRACCGGRDCRPVPCDEVLPTAGGWSWNGIEFSQLVMKPSPDGGCHVCFSPNAMGANGNPFGLCIFLRPET